MCEKRGASGLKEFVMASEDWMLKVAAAGMEEMEPQLEYKERMADKRGARLKGMLVYGSSRRQKMLRKSRVNSG